MSEPDAKTIPISGTLPISTSSRTLLGSMLFSIFRFACYAGILVALGWGAWKYLGPSSKTDEAEVTAELDGFQAAPAFHVIPRSVDSSLSTLASRPSAPAAGEISLPDLAPPELSVAAKSPSNGTFISSNETSTNVWLTGTIELVGAGQSTNSGLQISNGTTIPQTLR